MDTKVFSVLKVILRHGSLGKAAGELHYTQPGLSSMMNRFEAELGVKLLLRDSLGVRLTAEGEVLLPMIEDILNASENFLQAVGDIKSRKKSDL